MCMRKSKDKKYAEFTALYIVLFFLGTTGRRKGTVNYGGYY